MQFTRNYYAFISAVSIVPHSTQRRDVEMAYSWAARGAQLRLPNVYPSLKVIQN